MMEISLDFSFLLNKENFNIKLIFDVWRHDGEKLSQTKITSIFVIVASPATQTSLLLEQWSVLITF